MTPRSAVSSGDRLVALPSYHPQVLLSPAIQLELVGPATVRMLRPQEDGVSSFDIEDGRFWLLAVGKADTQVRVKFGERHGTILLKSADALVALDVANFLPPGSNPETTTAIKVARLYGVEGQAEWQETTAENMNLPPAPLGPGTMAAFVSDRPMERIQVTAMPNWMTGSESPVERLDRLASPVLNGVIVPSRPVRLSLQEKISDRRQEVRSLAARSLGYLSDFDAYFAFDNGVLRDDTQRSHWESHFESLRQALARGAGTAIEARRVLEKYRPGKAADLYRMLWGYAPEQLEAPQGGAEQLVSFLDHEDLDFRVLAFANLTAITGRTQEYAPYKSAAQRKGSVRAWQDRLKEGLVVYKELPSPLAGLEKLAEPAAAP